MSIKILKREKMKGRNRTLFILFFMNFFLFNDKISAQKSDSIKFDCICTDNSFKKIEHTVFYKKMQDTYIINFNIANSANDTLISINSKIYYKKVLAKNIIFDFKNSKFQNTIYSLSGLGTEVFYIKKEKINKLNYFKFGFHSFISDMPFISGLVISNNFEIYSFIYFDSFTHFNCVRLLPAPQDIH